MARQRAPSLLAEGLRLAREAHPGPTGLYLHVPFCVHKCHYCDFYSIVDTRDRQAAFVARLERELATLRAGLGPIHLSTVFVGGGTPTLLRTDLWRQVLDALDEHMGLAQARERPGFEWTIECNPETAGAELFEVLASRGVNRLSFGAQSFNHVHLKTLERWHDPASVPRAIGLARAAGIDRLSLDLIFAIPGQTLGEALDDIERALDLGVTHVSAYALTFEPGTAMTARLARGEFPRADEDLEADMYEAIVARLGSAGLRRYEVSNFAAPGHQCAHNLGYWRMDGWLAAGPSASGHLHVRPDASFRWKNVPRLESYLEGEATETGGLAPIVEFEAPDPRRLVVEELMGGIRLAEGLDAARMCARAEAARPRSAERLAEAADQLRARSWLDGRSDRWALTDAGFLFADAAARALIAAVGP